MNPVSISLGAGDLTDGRIGDDTGRFESSVADLNVVIGTKFEDDRELACLRSNTVSDVILVDSVVRDTANKLTSSVSRSFESAIHGCWFACHN